MTDAQKRSNPLKANLGCAATAAGFVPHPLAALGKAGIDATRHVVGDFCTYPGSNQIATLWADTNAPEDFAAKRRAVQAMRRWEKAHLLPLVAGLSGVELGVKCELFRGPSSIPFRRSSIATIDFRPVVALLAALAADERVWATASSGIARFGTRHPVPYYATGNPRSGHRRYFDVVGDGSFRRLALKLGRWRGVQSFSFLISLARPSAHVRAAIARRAADLEVAASRPAT